MSCEIRPYAFEFRDRVLDLQQHLWSPDPAVNERCFAWKYEHNPWLPEPLIFLAVDAGRVVGMRGAFALPWVAGNDGRPLRALCAGDTVVAPSHRRRGLAGRVNEALVAEARRAGWRFLVNTSGGAVVRRLSLGSGWRATEEIRPLIHRPEPAADGEPAAQKPRRSLLSRAAARVSRRLRPSDPGPLGDLHRRLHRGTKESPGRLHASAEVRPEAMAARVASLPPRGGIRCRKDAAFFRWRFANPLWDYRFLYAEDEDGRLTAYLALHSHDRRFEAGFNLVDWEAESPAALTRLVRLVVAAAGAKPVRTWPCGADPAFDASLEAAGFDPVSDPEPPEVLPAVLSLPLQGGGDDGAWIADGADLTRLQSWDLRMMVSDFY